MPSYSTSPSHDRFGRTVHHSATKTGQARQDVKLLLLWNPHATSACDALAKRAREQPMQMPHRQGHSYKAYFSEPSVYNVEPIWVNHLHVWTFTANDCNQAQIVKYLCDDTFDAFLCITHVSKFQVYNLRLAAATANQRLCCAFGHDLVQPIGGQAAMKQA
eukprot:scaffold20227_cov21-Prasinocladus_malaysianus.AAC.1